MSDAKCPSCGEASLQRGFIHVRNSENPTLFDSAVWVAGAPHERLELIAAGKSEQFKLEPHRCAGCGHVAWFAPTASAWRR